MIPNIISTQKDFCSSFPLLIVNDAQRVCIYKIYFFIFYFIFYIFHFPLISFPFFLLIYFLFFLVSFFLLLNPPQRVSSPLRLKLWAYTLSIILGISWGCSEVAHHSIASQLTYDYDERTKLQVRNYRGYVLFVILLFGTSDYIYVKKSIYKYTYI